MRHLGNAAPVTRTAVHIGRTNKPMNTAIHKRQQRLATALCTTLGHRLRMAHPMALQDAAVGYRMCAHLGSSAAIHASHATRLGHPATPDPMRSAERPQRGGRDVVASRLRSGKCTRDTAYHCA